MLLYGADTILRVLALALALDAVLGEALFRRAPHPVALAGRVIAWLDRTLNPSGAHARAAKWRGALTVAVMVAAAAMIGATLAWIFRLDANAWLLEALAASALLAQRSLFEHVRAVAAGLERAGLDGGRRAVAHIVGRDPSSLDEHGVSRAAVESLAENFSDGVIAPAFWFLLLGLPGIAVYKTVNTLDSMIGYRTPRYRDFGMVAARLDDAMNLVPARLSGLLIALAMLAIRPARIGAALTSMLRDAGKHRSPNAGWPEAAMAGALNIKLAGPRRYKDEIVEAPYIGPGTADVTPADIRRGLAVYVATCLIHALLIAGAALYVA